MPTRSSRLERTTSWCWPGTWVKRDRHQHRRLHFQGALGDGRRDASRSLPMASSLTWTPSNAGLRDRADYAQVIKVYSKQEEGRERYSPGDFVDPGKEGDNQAAPTWAAPARRTWNGRMEHCAQWCKRLTRLTYAFSKKWDNLKAALLRCTSPITTSAGFTGRCA